MDSKQSIWIGVTIGGLVGGFIPLLWGASELSFSSIIFSTIGAIIGIWVAYKISH